MTRIKTVLTSLLILLLSGDLSAQEASEAASQPTFDRSQPPEPGEPSPFVLPSVREVTLSNGLMVTIVDRPGSPTLSVRLSVRAGRDSKPDNIAVPVLTARLLRDGTEAMDSEELANFIDRNGISFGFGVHTNSVIFAADALADKDTQVLTLLADLVGKASFPEDRVTARQAELVGELQLASAQPAFHQRRLVSRVLFGLGHAYSETYATPEQVETVSRVALESYYRSHYFPGRADLVIVGQVNEGLETLLEETLGQWTGEGTAYAPPEVPEVAGCNVAHVVVRPDSAQTSITWLGRGVSIESPNYFDALVANQVLGGGASARLFMNLREDKSYTYGAYSYLSEPLNAPYFGASSNVRGVVTTDALREFVVELSRFATDPITESEFDVATSYLEGVFPIKLETNQQIAGRLISLFDAGLPPEYLLSYRNRVASVANEGALDLGRSFINYPNLDLVMVGEEESVIPAATSVSAVVHVYDLNGSLVRSMPGEGPTTCELAIPSE